MKTLRVALLGTGSIVSHHIEALRSASPAVEIAAAVNPDLETAQAFCQTHTIPHAYDNTPAMLEAIQPDIVHICPSRHTPQIDYPMSRGRCMGGL
jgi:predicted dehydrogenase